MATPQRQASSGSDGDQRLGVIDERKRKRMESNRESARRSRQRKQEQLNKLVGQVKQLQEGNAKMRERVKNMIPSYHAVEAQNDVLRAQIAELNERLDSLNEVVRFTETMMGINTTVNTFYPPQLTDTLIEPWLLSSPFEPIAAASNMFQY